MTAPSSQYSSLASAPFTDERVLTRRSPVAAGCPFAGQRADTSDHIDPKSSCLKPTGERACSAPASQRSRGPPFGNPPCQALVPFRPRVGRRTAHALSNRRRHAMQNPTKTTVITASTPASEGARC
jgi:hypothetical protein